MLDAIVTSPHITFAIGILSLIVGLYTWIKGRTKRQLSCFVATHELVNGGKSIVPDLKLVYKEDDIENLVITRYIIWNSGNVELRSGDIVAKKPLSIISKSETTKFLDAQIVNFTDEDNSFSVKNINSGCVEISFDHMNQNDGVVLQILHTGCASAIDVQGKLIGGKPLKYITQDVLMADVPNEVADAVFGLGALSILATSIFWVLLEMNIISYEVFENWPTLSTKSAALLTLVCAVLICVCWATWHTGTYRLKIPSALRNTTVFDETLQQKN